MPERCRGTLDASFLRGLTTRRAALRRRCPSATHGNARGRLIRTLCELGSGGHAQNVETPPQFVVWRALIDLRSRLVRGGGEDPITGGSRLR